MALYRVSGGTTGAPSDLDQIVDALTAKNDVGTVSLYQQITPPGAPTVAVNSTSGNLSGNYQYAVAFLTGYWEGQAGSGTLNVQGNTGGGTPSTTVSPSGQQVNITNIPIGGPGVVARVLYRTKANGSTFYFLQQIDDNVTTSWTDNVPDASLGAQMPTVNTTGTVLQLQSRQLAVTDTGLVSNLHAQVADNLNVGGTFVPAQNFARTDQANTFTGNQTAPQWVSNAPQGTPPLQVSSSTMVAGLNAELVGGKRASDLALASDLSSHVANDILHVPYAAATGSANTYAITLNPAPSAYTEGMAVAVKINVDNTGASTINVNGLGAIPIKKPNGNDVAAGNLKAGSIYTLRYNGTNFILQGEGGGGTAQPGDVLSGKTFTNDVGDQTGAMPNNGAVVITPGTSNITIPAGYHNGSGYVVGDPNLIAANIKNGVSIFGVLGSLQVRNVATGTVQVTSQYATGYSVTCGFQPNFVLIWFQLNPPTNTSIIFACQWANLSGFPYPNDPPSNNNWCGWNWTGGSAGSHNITFNSTGFSFTSSSYYSSGLPVLPASYHWLAFA